MTGGHPEEVNIQETEELENQRASKLFTKYPKWYCKRCNYSAVIGGHCHTFFSIYNFSYLNETKILTHEQQHGGLYIKSIADLALLAWSLGRQRK